MFCFEGPLNLKLVCYDAQSKCLPLQASRWRSCTDDRPLNTYLILILAALFRIVDASEHLVFAMPEVARIGFWIFSSSGYIIVLKAGRLFYGSVPISGSERVVSFVSCLYKS